MHTVRISAHLDAARDPAVAVDGGAVGGERGDARLRSQASRVETEGFLEDVVEEREGVDGARGGEEAGVLVRGVSGVVVATASWVDDRRAEGEEFAAETVLEVGALTQFVHEVGERDARGLMAGYQMVEHFRRHGQDGVFQARVVRLRRLLETLGQALVDHRLRRRRVVLCLFRLEEAFCSFTH